MILYMANCTKQHRLFHFRVPESPRLFEVEIPAGDQRRVWKEDTAEVINAIIEQMTRYGFCDVSTASRERHFVGVCFSIDKPVPAKVMDYTIDRNDGVMDDVALLERKRAAAALANNSEALRGGMRADSIEMTLEETADRSAPDRVLASETIALGERRSARGR